MSFSLAISLSITSKRKSGSGIFPAPVSPHAKRPFCGSTTPIPYFLSLAILSCVIWFSNIAVFMAGETIFLHFDARKVVVSISSAIPFAILAITFAVAGAIIKMSAFFASDICSTSNLKFLSKVST